MVFFKEITNSFAVNPGFNICTIEQSANIRLGMLIAEGQNSVDVILHVGAHRTGTTTFQGFLNDNRTAFRSAGVAFWGPGRIRKGMFAGLIRDPDCLSSNDRRVAKRSVGRVHVEIARAKSFGMSQLVVSEENMLGTMAKNLNQIRLYPQAEPRMARFGPAFGGNRLAVSLSIRSYETYWSSAVAFKIKTGFDLPCPDMLDRLVTQPRRWSHVIRDIRAALPEAEIIVWPFEGWAARPSQVCEMLTGHKIGSETLETVRNAAPDPKLLSEILQDRGDFRGSESMREHARNYRPFDLDQIAKLQDDYREDIRWLKSGADGLAFYFDPTGDTSGGAYDLEGSQNEHEGRQLAGAG